MGRTGVRGALLGSPSTNCFLFVGYVSRDRSTWERAIDVRLFLFHVRVRLPRCQRETHPTVIKVPVCRYAALRRCKDSLPFLANGPTPGGSATWQQRIASCRQRAEERELKIRSDKLPSASINLCSGTHAPTITSSIMECLVPRADSKGRRGVVRLRFCLATRLLGSKWRLGRPRNLVDVGGW